MNDISKYEKRGVSTDKEDVHNAIKNLDKGLFPNAFCKILPDIAGNDPNYCNVMHADTAGTKTSLAYMYWKETGDLSVWAGIVQDAIVMNLDDMACAGIVDNIILSSTIGRNKNLIGGEVVKAIIEGTLAFIDNMKKYGVNLTLAGGETADVGDIVKTIDVGFTAFARFSKNDVINIDIKPGNVIVGFASYGKSTYETEYNGGMGSNGLTSARHDVFSHEYAKKYPETYDHLVPDDLVYTGKLKLTDIEKETGITVGKLILSPTRTFLPVLKEVIAKHRSDIFGIIHCTGGAQTKVMKFVNNVHIIKNNLLPTPPLFKMIHEQSRLTHRLAPLKNLPQEDFSSALSGGTDYKEMYKVFNMGTRMEIYTNKANAEGIIAIAKQFNIDAQIIGYVEAAEKNKLTLITEYGTFEY